jgi:hypothetical protein
MPINPNDVPLLIRAAQAYKLPQWKKDFLQKVRDQLQVHTKGQLFSKIDTLFPNEHPDSKAHCVATYEPITKGSIWKGINNLYRIFSNSSFTIDVGEELRQWIEDYEYEGENLLSHFVKMWLHKAVAEDPNGIFVVYPPDWAAENKVQPLVFVRSEFIRGCGTTADGQPWIAFCSERDSKIDYVVENLIIRREFYRDYEELEGAVNARTFTEHTYNDRIVPKVKDEVIHLLTPDGIIQYKTSDLNLENNEINYKLIQFQDTLSCLPAFPGGGPIAEKGEEPLFESFVGSFIPFGNLALLQHRNHRAVDLTFSYPRMSELQMPCDKCTDGRRSHRKAITAENPLGLVDCERCRGTGFVTVQSPYKTYRRKYDPNDAGNNEHLKTAPVEFYSPDVAIIQYSKEAWKEYLEKAEEAIFIQQKQQTGNVESAKSKELNLDELYSWLLNVSSTFYGNLRHLLQALEEHLSTSPITCSVEKPYSFAILTEEEAFQALTNILDSDAPVFIKGNRIDEFVAKFISKNSPIVKMLVILKQYDLLLLYGTVDIQAYKAANVITQSMWTKHVVGYPLLISLYIQDKTILDQEPQAVMDILDAEIAKLNVPAADSNFKQALQVTLGNLNKQPIIANQGEGGTGQKNNTAA